MSAKNRMMVCVGACLACLEVFAQDTVEVTAKGFGRSPRDAEKDSVRAAVEQAVGMFVDAETLTRNEEVVNDQILTYSDGLVESKRVVSPPAKNKDGLYETTIVAAVKKSKVAEKIREVKLTGSQIKGEDLWAQEISKVNRSEDGYRILEKCLQEISIESLLRARVVDDEGRVGEQAVPTTRADSRDPQKVMIAFNVEITYERDEFYRGVAPRLVMLLDAIASKRAVDAVQKQIPTGHGEFIGHSTFRSSVLRQAVRGNEPVREFENEDAKYLRIAVETSRDEFGFNHRFATYDMDAGVYGKAWFARFREIKPLTVRLLDNADRLICSDQLSLDGSLYSDDTTKKSQHVVVRRTDTRDSTGNSLGLDGCRHMSLYGSYAKGVVERPRTQLFHFYGEAANRRMTVMISPEFWFSSLDRADTILLRYETTISLDELKSVHKIDLNF